MTEPKIAPGAIRDVILATLNDARGEPVKVADLYGIVRKQLGRDVPLSSIRSYLGNNTPGRFERVGRGSYRLAP